MIPKGYQATGLRFILSGKQLCTQFLLGAKWASTRGWKLRTEDSYRKACAKGLVVRVQSSWANHTIIGWALLRCVSPRGHPRDVVNEETVREAGCGHMTKDQYIAEYCMVTNEEGEKTVAEEVVVVYFAELWTREGRIVVRSIS